MPQTSCSLFSSVRLKVMKPDLQVSRFTWIKQCKSESNEIWFMILSEFPPKSDSSSLFCIVHWCESELTKTGLQICCSLAQWIKLVCDSLLILLDSCFSESLNRIKTFAIHQICSLIHWIKFWSESNPVCDCLPNPTTVCTWFFESLNEITCSSSNLWFTESNSGLNQTQYAIPCLILIVL